MHTARPLPLQIPQQLRRGTRNLDERRAVDVGEHLIRLMCQRVGIPSLQGKAVLDIGCGHRFTQAILEREIPVGRYVGIDVFADLIAYLKAHVHDPRFEFHHVNVHNDLYNPSGIKLRSDTKLPVQESAFDVVCLFSVFTHLNPDDFDAMLRITRRYVRPKGRLFFSAFVSRRQEVPFCDVAPSNPLRYAYYSEACAQSLIRNAGWHVLSQHRREPWIQEHFVCTRMPSSPL